MQYTDNGQYGRMLRKEVLKSRALNSTERWTHSGQGSMQITDDEVIMTSPTAVFDKIPHIEGRSSADCRVTYRIDRENLNAYNRIHFEVYPDMPGFYTTNLLLMVENDGKVKLPSENWREGLHFAQLKPLEWNEVILETAHLDLDEVTGITVIYRLQGSEPMATKTANFRMRNFCLEVVEPEYTEGWAVKSGGIAYCHSGYLPWAKKTALVDAHEQSQFFVLDENNTAVYTGCVEQGKMDFSDISTPGVYRLKTGDLETQPFVISDTALTESIEKTLDFFYAERCGMRVEGVHDVCHSDWQCEHDGKRIVINGGWHDAGDLSQLCINTAEAVIAMLDLAEISEEPLKSRLCNEAQWGIDWVLKTRFGDGFRSRWAVMDFWTDGIIGNDDDVVFRAANDPDTNMTAAQALAEASRNESFTPEYRYKCLAAAEEDYSFGIENAKETDGTLFLARGICAAASLYRCTKKEKYREDIKSLGEWFSERQGLESRGGFSGYFYRDSEKTQVYCDSHHSTERYMAEALSVLWEVTQDAKYQKQISLYGEYLEGICKRGNIYGTAPSCIYSEDGAKRIEDEEFRNEYLNQIKGGIPLGDGYYIKNFPVWKTFCGNTPLLLSKGICLARIADITGEKKYMDMAGMQLEWNLGRNPFCMSLMYGEGYDYSRYYSAMCGDLVGALPVGIQTRQPADVPYWSTACCFNYKEVWVHPSTLYLRLVTEIRRFAQKHINKS